MKHILIDTCSWIDLLSEDVNKLLPHLEFWVNNECINIVSHQVILKEWNKHKSKQKKRFSDSIKTKYKHAKEVVKKEKLSIPDILEPNFREIELQIETIDKLLANSIILNTSNKIKANCSDRAIEKKAPFHNKIDSTKDAYIIFTALKYFKEQNRDFVFISSNKNEFGARDNLELEIHPEIIEEFPGIKVTYFSDIGRAINSLKDVLPMSISSEIEDSTTNKQTVDKIAIDRNKPILDQLYDYIILRFKEASFFPLNLFYKHYPFTENNSPNPYYSLFTLTFRNKKLFELFKAVNIDDKNLVKITNPELYKGVTNHENKIEKILIGLTQNLIFNVSDGNTREIINIRYSKSFICQCPKCNFRKFKFSESFKSLNSYKENDILKSAYLHYLIGNYVNSAKKQIEATKIYKRKKENISSFISLYNSSKLSIFINNNYYGENSQDNLVQKLKNIDLDYLAKNLMTSEATDFTQHLKNDTFYTNARNRIQISTSKIIDYYYSQLNGGWSSNREVWVLINEFAKIDSYLNNNYIIYDQFQEFKDIFKTFLEGIFASHSINESHSSRLQNIDDWLIIQILHYGDDKTINKLFRRYKLKKLNYKKTSNTGDTFEDLINNFFSNEGLREAFTKNCEKGNRRFWDYYNRVFKNLLTLVSICDFDTNFINSFTKKLITYLEYEDFLNHLSYNSIYFYLRRCGNHIDNKLLKNFFILGLNNSVYHNSEYFESISDSLATKKIKVSKTEFLKIKNLAFEKCSVCNENHIETIVIPIWESIANNNYKTEIGNLIEQRLHTKYDFNLFYLASIYEVIKLNKTLLDKAVKESLPKKDSVSLKNIFSNSKDNRSDKVNSLINLCFKYNVDTTKSVFDEYKKIDAYYDWLLDMENFNYDKFDKNWISEYATRFYYKKIYKSKLTKVKIEELLIEDFTSKLETDYLNIYIRKTWKRKK